MQQITLLETLLQYSVTYFNSVYTNVLYIWLLWFNQYIAIANFNPMSDGCFTNFH